MSTFALILGVLFLVGLVRGIQTHLFIRRAVRVRAKVVATFDVSIGNPDPGSQSAPTLRHVVVLPVLGRRVPLADAFGGSFADKLVANDGAIAVIYDPRRPGIVRIDAPWALLLFDRAPLRTRGSVCIAHCVCVEQIMTGCNLVPRS